MVRLLDRPCCPVPKNRGGISFCKTALQNADTEDAGVAWSVRVGFGGGIIGLPGSSGLVSGDSGASVSFG